jgi:alanine racemase
MFETSVIELSQSALETNIRFLKKQIPKSTRFSSVIKGNAYGHGISFFVPLAEKCGIRHFSVFSANEALAAMKHRSAKSDITIMGAIENSHIPWAVENGISFYVFDTGRLKRAISAADKIGRKAKIHLELETGLNRTGLSGRELDQAIDLIKVKCQSVKLEGICTHFAGAESLSNYLRIQNQITRYHELCDELHHKGFNLGPGNVLRHTACSAAALIYPETILDMVRLGIAQYGFWPSKETEISFFTRKQKRGRNTRWKDPLVRVIKWKSRIMSTKRVRRGEYVGYGSSSLVTRNSRIAAVPVGYFHGFSRELSNRGYVLVRGQRAPVLGMVNMNMIMIDITHIPYAQKGNEVVLIGKQGDISISVGSFGELTRFINYELLVSLPSEIPRIIVS